MNRETTAPAPGKLAGLDGLRAIGAIGVCLYHILPFKVQGGFLGVLLFFALSGYLLAYTGERAWRKNGFSTLDFYKKRVVRIYPGLILTAFITIGVYSVIAPEALKDIPQQLLAIFTGTYNRWLIRSSASYFSRMANTSPFIHLWSTAIEMQFYLVWPALFIVWKKLGASKARGLRTAAAVCALIALCALMPLRYTPGADPSDIYYGTGTRVFSLLLGAAAAELQKRLRTPGWLRGRLMQYLCAAFYMAVVVAAFICVDGRSELTYRGGMLVMTLIFCRMIMLAADPELPFGRWLSVKPLDWIGRYSYEIYLWLYPVSFLAGYMKWNRGLPSFIIQVAAILALAAWMHTFTGFIPALFKKGSHSRGVRI